MRDNIFGFAFYTPEYAFDLVSWGGGRSYLVKSPLWDRQDNSVWINITPSMIKKRTELGLLNHQSFYIGEYGDRETGYRTNEVQ